MEKENETFQHSCIKCQENYKDNDPDAYYCPKCKDESKSIAKAVDKKLAGRVSKRVGGALQQYDEILAKTGGKFPNIGDLGIKL